MMPAIWTCQRNHKVLPLNEKNSHKDRKKNLTKLYARVAKIYGKNNHLLETVKEKETCASFAVTSQTTKDTVTACDYVISN